MLTERLYYFALFWITLIGCLESSSGQPIESVDDLDKEIDCSFEHGMCRWENYYQDSTEYDFIYGTSDILPSADDSVDRGVFLYVPARATSSPGVTYLRHDSLVLGNKEGHVCLHFDYLITADYIGSLTLWHYWWTEEYNYAAEWSSRGEPNYGSWQKGQIYLDSSSTWTLTFEAAVDGPGDGLSNRLHGIAIDNIQHELVASAGLCPTFPPQSA